MPMDREEYEEILERLNDPELTHTERSEMLQTLREDYNNVITEHTEHTEKLEKLTKEREDLLVANSKMFRQLGYNEQDESANEEQEQQNFSETVKLEDLEKNALQN